MAHSDDVSLKIRDQEIRSLRDSLHRAHAEVKKIKEEMRRPVPLILHCPQCSERHIDRGAFASKPHHTHACQFCGMVWRPAIINTVGVQFLPGFKDS